MMTFMPGHLGRYKELGQLALKYSRVDFSSWGDESKVSKDTQGEDGGALTAEDLVRDVESLGPTFVKLGQLLSTRVDFLPAPVCEALSRLQDGVAPVPMEEIRAQIEGSLGMAIEDVYDAFEEEPLGAASLAQVHKARLKNGEAVVVKVQRPNAPSEVKKDLALLLDVATFLEQVSEKARHHDLLMKVKELEKVILNELDFSLEMANLLAIRKNLESFERLVVPRVWERCCTDRVLTMELMEGQKLTDLGGLGRTDVDGEELARTLVRAYLKQCLEDGMFHADPHPGNVLLRDDGSIALIDMGMVARLSPEMQKQLTRIVLLVGEGAGDEVAEVLLEIGELREHFQRYTFCEQVSRLVVQYHTATISQLNFGELLYQMAQCAATNGVRLPSFLLMLAKTFLHLEDLGQMLAPSFSPQDEITALATSLATTHMKRHWRKGHVLTSALAVEELMERMPVRLNRIIDQLAKNELSFKVDAFDQAALTTVLQKIANRITSGLVIAAMLVGAALMMKLETSFSVFGYPVIALVVFLAAFVGGGVLTLQVFFQDR